jgi:drug/metabolite transporter (DMT)-like permease
VTGIAVGLALLAAAAHAAWNLRLKEAADPLGLAARAVPVGTLVAAPAVLMLWLAGGRPGLSGLGWVLVGVSLLLELAYFHLLSAAYRRGEVSSVYPVARGTAPLLAVAAGLILFRERLDWTQLGGILSLLAGIWLVTFPRGSRASLGLALLSGICIAAYTAIDSRGVRLGPFWLYSWLVFAGLSLALIPFRGGTRLPGVPAAGVLMVGSYCLVLAALSIAPLALVAPLRESGVVLVALWGVLRLGEREGAWFKLSGAAAVVAGAVLLTAG